MFLLFIVLLLMMQLVVVSAAAVAAAVYFAIIARTACTLRTTITVEVIVCSRVKFTGCYSKEVVVDKLTCNPNNPQTDNHLSGEYRHFAVDEANGIVYFCDRNPKRPLDKPACFSSDRNSANKEWNGKEGGWHHTRTSQQMCFIF